MAVSESDLLLCGGENSLSDCSTLIERAISLVSPHALAFQSLPRFQI
jgi:hypothetical protein